MRRSPSPTRGSTALSRGRRPAPAAGRVLAPHGASRPGERQRRAVGPNRGSAVSSTTQAGRRPPCRPPRGLSCRTRYVKTPGLVTPPHADALGPVGLDLTTTEASTSGLAHKACLISRRARHRSSPPRPLARNGRPMVAVGATVSSEPPFVWSSATITSRTSYCRCGTRRRSQLRQRESRLGRAAARHRLRRNGVAVPGGEHRPPDAIERSAGEQWHCVTILVRQPTVSRPL